MCKKVNLDELIKNSEIININDPCPFCKGKDKFINAPENDFVKHIIEEHKPQFAKIIGKVEKE